MSAAFTQRNITTRGCFTSEGGAELNIDTDAIKIEASDIKRPADVNINAAVSNVRANCLIGPMGSIH